ncbi:MAG: hypothetical protein ACI87E_002526 [Mariniblastus sp.]
MKRLLLRTWECLAIFLVAFFEIWFGKCSTPANCVRIKRAVRNQTSFVESLPAMFFGLAHKRSTFATVACQLIDKRSIVSHIDCINRYVSEFRTTSVSLLRTSGRSEICKYALRLIEHSLQPWSLPIQMTASFDCRPDAGKRNLSEGDRVTGIGQWFGGVRVEAVFFMSELW